MNLGQAIYDLFGANGEWGLVLCIFLIFLLDALLIPTLPELFFVLAFIVGANYGHPLLFGVELLIAAVIAEQIGIFSLYLVVKKYNHKIPKKIQSALDKYTQFLVVSDEKLLLLNRVAPMLPFAGAFVRERQMAVSPCTTLADTDRRSLKLRTHQPLRLEKSPVNAASPAGGTRHRRKSR